MAQLIQCDFCGNITNQIAARVSIDINPAQTSAALKQALLQQTINARSDYAYERSVLVKDCCSNCVEKFIDPKPQVLMITPSGTEVKKEDL